MHTPVLLQKAVEGLALKKQGVYIDATVGEGGHLVEIVKGGGKVLGIDADANQITNLKNKIKQDAANLTLVQANFRDIETVARQNGFFPVDGILFDLGLSMEQIIRSGRGFSFKKYDEPLDMRLDVNQDKTAAELVNTLSAAELYELFASFSEDLNSQKVADAIVSRRKRNMIATVGDLLQAIDQAVLFERTGTYARIFQALRIAVNDEFGNLKSGLTGAMKILKPDGRLVVITFHSLEDRLVKRFVIDNGLKQINKKVFSHGQSKFERSAKIRVITF